MSNKQLPMCPVHHKPKTGVIHYCKICREERGRKGGTARGQNLSPSALKKIAMLGVKARRKKSA